MATPLLTTHQRFRLDQSDPLVIPCSQFRKAMLQFVLPHGATWSSAVVAVQVSIDGANPQNLPAATTITGPGITGPLDVSDYAYLHLTATANEGTAPNEAVLSIYLTDFGA